MGRKHLLLEKEEECKRLHLEAELREKKETRTKA